MASSRIVKKTLADGTVKEYRYDRDKPAAPDTSDSIGALLEAYHRAPEWRGLRPATQKSYDRYLAHLDALAPVPVTALRRREILAIRDLISERRGPAAGNKFVRVVATLLAWAVDREWIQHSPATRIRAAAGGHMRAWTVAEYDRIVPLLPEHLRRAVVLARYTGQRRGDLVALPWTAYNGATVRLRQQKTGTALVIPAAAPLKAELDVWRRDASAVQILTSKRGLPWLASHLSWRLGVALAAIDPSFAGLNIHGLRLLAATSLAEAGCSTHEIASITGHRTLTMVSLYTKSADQERLAGAAIERLDNWR